MHLELLIFSKLALCLLSYFTSRNIRNMILYFEKKYIKYVHLDAHKEMCTEENILPYTL